MHKKNKDVVLKQRTVSSIIILDVQGGIMTSILSNTLAGTVNKSVTTALDQVRKASLKLSSGQGIVNASDDTAGLSIGIGLRVDTNVLKTVLKTAGQAKLALNVADGALENITDLLERNKALSTQANSGSLSDTERGFLNQEFANNTAEIDRLVDGTEFNGVNLIDGSINGNATLELDFNATTSGTTAITITVSGTANVFTFGASTVTFASNAQTIGTGTGSTAASDIATTINDNNGSTADFAGFSASSNGASLTITGIDEDFSFSIASTPNDAVEAYTVNGGVETDTAATAVATTTVAGTEDLDFQVGTNTTDTISVALRDASTSNLYNSATLTVDTAANAQTASAALDDAIDLIKSMRASAGSLQSRFEFASNNMATSIQNYEAASAAFLDADIAETSTVFAQAQVRMQAGISVLAQANQLPAALLKLINN